MKCFRAFTLGMLLFVSTIYTTVSSPNGLESSSSEPCLTIKSCMDPISGSFFLSSTDLVVPGYEPIVIQRSYSSDAQEGREARFSLLSHAYLHFEIDPISKSGRPFLIIASEPAGGTLHYKNHVANKGKDSYQYFPKLGKATQGLTNIGHGVITSQNNISLNRIVYDPSISLYVLTIGDGTQRFYQKNNNGFAHLVKERKPNGNWVFYKYTVTYALSEIQTTNPSATKVYSTVRFEYENLNPYNSKTFAILTDTQKYLHYSYHLDEVKKGKDNKHFFRLNCIEHPTLPQEHFSYIEVKSKPSTFLIHQQRLQQKIVKEVDYYACTTTPLEHRIRSLSQPVGETDELVTTDTFHYNLGDYSEKRKKKPKHYLESDGTTEHRDVYDKKTIYRFDEHFVPSHIEKYGRPLNQENGSSDTLLYKESFAWYPSELTNRLRWQCTEANNKVLSLKMYNYDDNGNILEDILVGNLSGHDPNSIQLGLYMRSLLRESLANPRNETYVIKNTYYEGIPSLLHTKELPNGLRHVYTYLPGTNLVTACYTQQGDTLLARYFKLYNEDNVLIQEIQDNGTTQDINNLSGITERHVRCISVKNSQPALNFPEVVEEKYLDIASNTYRLLKKSIFSYNASCQVVEEAVYDANDNYAYSLKYSYDAKDRLISSQDALGRLSYFSYDDFNRVTEEKQASSPLIIRHEYDSLGRERFLRVADSTGDTSETKFHYDLKSRLIKTLDADHNTLEMSYDDLDHETKQILPTLLDENGTVQKPCIRKVNDIFGNILSETDARGFTTTSTYSAYHKPVHVTYPDGLYENFRYTREGLVDLHVSTSGTKTLYTYDCLGRILTKRVFPKERSARYEETFSYDAFHLLSQTDRSGTKTTYRYDGAGRKISTTTTRQGELLSKEGYDYDSLGRLYKTTSHSLDPQIPDQVHIQTFDLANRLIEERQEDSTGTCFSKTQYLYDTYDRKIATLRYLDTDSWAEERYTYDDKGRVTSYTDAEGNVTLTFYKDKLHNSQTDSYENEVITQDALGRRVIERYSSTKKLISTTSFNSDNAILSQEFFYYDVVGNKTKHLSRLFHEGSSLQEHVTVWEYDSHNRITTQIEAYQTPHEKTTRFTYTTDGQEKCVTQPDGSYLSYTYDPLNRLIKIASSDNSIHYSFEYNALDQVICETNHITNTSTERIYNTRGDLIEEKLANGLTLVKEYDALGRRTKLILPDASSIHYSFDAFHLKKLTRYFPDGTLRYEHNYLDYNLRHQIQEESCIFSLGSLSKRYNKNGRLISTSSPYFSDTFTQFDACQNIQERSIHSDLGSYITSYNYDDLDHLIQEEGLFQNSYTFDSHHRRLAQDTTSYTYTPLDEILQAGNTSYGYSPNGLRNLKTIGNQSLSYKYDAFHRLISLTTENISITFTYDSWHRRLSKKVLQKNFFGHWETYTEESYLYDGDLEIGSVDHNKTITTLRVLGIGKGADIGSAIAIELRSTPYLPLHDLLGNVCLLIHPDNYVAESYRYNAFGEERLYNYYHLTLQSSWLGNPWRYQSKRLDEESGLVFFGRRYYDPKVGSWLEPDPLGLQEDLNLYQFLRGNPLSCIDFYGTATSDQEEEDSAEDTVPPSTASPTPSPSPPYRPFNPPPMTSLYAGDDDFTTNFDPSIYINPTPSIPAGYKAGTPLSAHAPKPPPQVHPIENRIPYSQSYHYHPRYDFAFINGINTSFYEATEMASSIVFNMKYKVNLFYNQTGGLLSDIWAVRKHHKNISLPITRDLSSYLFRQVSHGKDVFLFAHSAGGVIAHNALQRLPTSFRNHIHVVSFGPAKFVPENYAKSVTNYVSWIDLVSLGSNHWHTRINSHLSILSVVQNNKIPIHWLKPHSMGIMKEHAFMGKTYQKALRYKCDSLKMEHGL